VDALLRKNAGSHTTLLPLPMEIDGKQDGRQLADNSHLEINGNCSLPLTGSTLKPMSLSSKIP